MIMKVCKRAFFADHKQYDFWHYEQWRFCPGETRGILILFFSSKRYILLFNKHGNKICNFCHLIPQSQNIFIGYIVFFFTSYLLSWNIPILLVIYKTKLKGKWHPLITLVLPYLCSPLPGVYLCSSTTSTQQLINSEMPYYNVNNNAEQ